MAPAISLEKRNRALRALKEAESFIQGASLQVTDDAQKLVDVLMEEGQRVQQAGTALVLALLSDEYTPAEMFKPWASVRRIQQWRDDPEKKLDVKILHGRTCVKPSAFFALWRTLPDESKRDAITLPTGHSAGATLSHPGGRDGSSNRRARA
jgi:hypothetical protein